MVDDKSSMPPITPEAPMSSDNGGEQLTLAGVLGEITWIFSQQRSHRHLFIADLEWLVMPPVLAGQYRIFRTEQGPIGVALWAYLSEKAEKRIAEGLGRLAPKEWRSGENLWIIDLVAPFGGEDKMIEDMKKTVFKGMKFKYQSTDQNGKGEIVEGVGEL